MNTLRAERDAARAERDAALDMVAEVGRPLGALSMPQIHRNADVVKALRQREIAAKETVKRLGDGIMRCIDASWSGTRSMDWTHPELILAEYVDALRTERAAADEALAACQSQGHAAVANLYALCRRMKRQKTDHQREVLLCHATRIASLAGVETCVMPMLRGAEPDDTVTLMAERDAALAERDEWKERAEAVVIPTADAYEAQVAELRAAITEARRVLREVEWDYSGECPLCGGLRDGDTHVYHASHIDVVRGHFPNCALAAVLAQEEK